MTCLAPSDAMVAALCCKDMILLLLAEIQESIALIVCEKDMRLVLSLSYKFNGFLTRKVFNVEADSQHTG